MIFFSFSFTRQVDEFFSLIRYIFENSGFLRRSQKSKTFDVTNYCNNRIDFLNTSIFNKWIAYNWCFFKVWVFWEGHKIWKNLRRTFDKSIVFCARNSVLVKKSTEIFQNKCGQVIHRVLCAQQRTCQKVDEDLSKQMWSSRILYTNFTHHFDEKFIYLTSIYSIFYSF